MADETPAGQTSLQRNHIIVATTDRHGWVQHKVICPYRHDEPDRPCRIEADPSGYDDFSSNECGPRQWVAAEGLETIRLEGVPTYGASFPLSVTVGWSGDEWFAMWQGSPLVDLALRAQRIGSLLDPSSSFAVNPPDWWAGIEDMIATMGWAR